MIFKKNKIKFNNIGRYKNNLNNNNCFINYNFNKILWIIKKYNFTNFMIKRIDVDILNIVVDGILPPCPAPIFCRSLPKFILTTLFEILLTLLNINNYIFLFKNM